MAMMRRRPPPPLMRVGLLVTSAVLLIASALWAGSVGPWIARPQGARPPTQRPTSIYLTNLPTLPAITPSAPPATAGSSWNPSIVLYALGAVLLVALLLIAAAMIRTGGGPPPTGRPSPEPDPVTPTGPMPDQDRPFDAREAADYVIARWDELEHQAAARGAGRRREQTPTEFIRVLGLIYPLDDSAAAELLGLYQRARFDHVRLLPDTAVRARVCADTVVAVVTSSPVAR